MSSSEYLNNILFEKHISEFKVARDAMMLFQTLNKDYEYKIKNNFYIPSSWSEKNFEYKIAFNKFRETQAILAKDFHMLSSNLVKYVNRFAKTAVLEEDDIVQEGVMICFEKLDRFDPTRGSKAFNYISTVIINSYRQFFRSLNNYNELKKRYLEHLQSKGFVRQGK